MLKLKKLDTTTFFSWEVKDLDFIPCVEKLMYLCDELCATIIS